MLAVEVTFLTGRYVATSYNDRQRTEWPPHPARLFSALAATYFAEPEPSGDERAALEWLEGQAAPLIGASSATEREVVTVFVPVNDTTVLEPRDHAGFEARFQALELAAAEVRRLQQVSDSRSPATDKKGAAALAKAQKAAGRRRMEWEKVVTGAVAATDSTDAGRKAAASILPEGRTRQPRTFPSVTPADARVVFVWPDAQPSEPHWRALDSLASRVVRLGHSSSLVTVRLLDEPQEANWFPDERGRERVRVVQSGQLADLERRFEQHRETLPRVMPARIQRYSAERVAAANEARGSIFGDDWLVLQRIGGTPLTQASTVAFAKGLRRVLLKYAAEPIPELLSGHGTNGKSESPHLALVPLPFVGSKHANGTLLGVALVLPGGATGEGRTAVFRALDRWEAAERLEDEDPPTITLRMGPAGPIQLRRVEGGRAPRTLDPATWCRAATAWVSATPVALDRNPGDLHAREPAKLAAAISEAEAIVRTACERIGLPDPGFVEVLPAAPLAGSAKTRAYPSFPPEPGKTVRVLTHVRLGFDSPVRGPVCIGAGRYFGLGFFRPVSQ